MARKGSALTRFHAEGPPSDLWDKHGLTNTIYSDTALASAVGIGFAGKPNHRLHINGSLSATDTIYTSAGNSVQWNTAYTQSLTNQTDIAAIVADVTNVANTSAQWDTTYTTTNSFSGKWEYTNISSPGTVEASKAVVVDGSKDITGFRNVTIDGNLTVMGTTATLSAVDTLVKDKLITLNDGGLDDSGHNVGFEIEENGSITGYIKTGTTAFDDDKWLLKAPDGNILTLDVNADKTLTVGGNLTVEADSNINQDVTSDASPSFASAIISDITIEPAGSGITGGVITANTGDLYLYSAGGTVHVRDNLDTSFQATDFSIKDNVAESLTFQESTNKYISIDTLDSAEHVRVWKPLSLIDNLSADANMFVAGGASLSGAVTLLGGLTADATGTNPHHAFMQWVNIPARSSDRVSLQVLGGIKAGDSSNDKFELNIGYVQNSSQVYYDLTKKVTDSNNPGIAFRSLADTSKTTMVINAEDQLVGIGTVAPSHTLHVVGEVGVSEYIKHVGDTDTFVQFTDDDINVQAGGVDFIKITEDGTQDQIRFNDGGVDVDFVIETEDTTDAFTIDGNAVGSATFKIPVTVGVDDTGHDVKFFGATSGQYLLWDESADELVLAGDTKLSFHDAAGGENIIATSDGHLEVNAGTTLDATAPTIDLNGATEVNVDCGIFDVNATGVIDLGGASTITLDAATDIILDAAGADIVLKHSGTESGKFTQDGATSLTLDVVGDLILDADGGNITLKDSGTHGLDIANSSGDWTIKPLTTDKDVIFAEDGGNEIARFDSSAEALLMATDKKIEFRDNTEYIHSGADGHLDHVAATEIHLTAPTVNIDASSETNISNNLVVGGDLTVNGTTTTVNSTTVTVDDPIITLGGDSAPGSDDSKDRGVEFRYYSGSAKVGFFGFDTTNDRFTFLTDATNSSEVFSGTLGDIEVGGGYIGNIRVGVTGDNEIDTSSGNLTIDSTGGTTTIDDIVVVSGASTLQSTLNVQDAVDLDSTLNVDSNTTLGGTLNTTGAVTFKSTLNTGNTTIHDTLSTVGAVTLGTTLNVDSNTTIHGTLSAVGHTSIEGNTSLSGNLTIGNASGDNITINSGTVSVNNPLNFDSNTFVITPATDLVSIGTASGLGKATIEDNAVAQLALNYSSTRTSYLSTDSSGDLHIKARSGRHVTFDDRDVKLRKIQSENSGSLTFEVGNSNGDELIFKQISGSAYFQLDGENGDIGINMDPSADARLSIKDGSSDQLRLHHNNNNYVKLHSTNKGVLQVTGVRDSNQTSSSTYISGGKIGIANSNPTHTLTVGNNSDEQFALHIHSFGSVGATPPVPGDGEGGLLYTDANGNLNYISNSSQTGLQLSKVGMNKNGKVSESGNDGVPPISASSNAGGFGDDYTSNGCIDAKSSGSFANGYASGSTNAKIHAVHTGDFAIGHAYSGTIYASGGGFGSSTSGGSFAGGLSEAYGTITTNRGGAFAFGNAYGGSGGYGGGSVGAGLSAAHYGSVTMGLGNKGKLMTQGKGGFALGHAFSNTSSFGYDTNAYVHSQGSGSFAMGYAKMNYGSFSDQSDSYIAKVHSIGAGSIAQGYASVDATSQYTYGGGSSSLNKDAKIYTAVAAKGGFATGFALASIQRAFIKSGGAGAVAMGYAKAATIEAAQKGSFAGGHAVATGTSGVVGNSVANYKIFANSAGAFSFGYAKNAYIKTNNEGAIAMGFANGANINSSSQGSLAIGYAKAGAGGAIEAVSKNAMQFGYGTNNVAHSLAVGKNLRFRDDNFADRSVHVSSNKRVGDFWIKTVGSTDYVYVHSGGSDIKLS